MSVSPISALLYANASTNPALSTREGSSSTSRTSSRASQTDGVKLSLSAQIKQMYAEGLTPDTIASQFSLSKKDLGEYIPALAQAAAAMTVNEPVVLQTPPSYKPKTAVSGASAVK